MKKKTLLIVVLAALAFSRCGNEFKQNFIHDFQQGPNGMKIPEPEFDKPTDEILNDLKVKYDPAAVRLGRPFSYSSAEDLKYWIKIAFLNPELGRKSVKDFEREIATEVVNHLTNPTDFDQIEVAVTKKKGFIVTFSTSENMFFSVDSLRVNGAVGKEPVN
ncbi:MAG TPA: hypothetical protein VFW11_15015 [Cyclobacteriaceae bacterium]|nr:hypothetical protein [Cyclobacteriaceae bacterium]